MRGRSPPLQLASCGPTEKDANNSLLIRIHGVKMPFTNRGREGAVKRMVVVSTALMAFLAIPFTAFAVNVSSSEGYGNQGAALWYSCGALTRGQLRSTYGNPVYYAGMQMFNGGWADQNVGRYTSDVTATYDVYREGNIGGTSVCTLYPYFTGVKVRICRNRNNLPDICGSWAAEPR